MYRFDDKRPKYDFERQIVGGSLCEAAKIEREPVERTGTADLILQQIYAPDPVTRLPNSDIMCFLSSDTPIEVKNFIQQNLLSPVTAEKVGLATDMDSDTICFVNVLLHKCRHTICIHV